MQPVKKALKDFNVSECFRFNETGSVYFVSHQFPSLARTTVVLVNSGIVDTRKSDIYVYPVDVETL